MEDIDLIWDTLEKTIVELEGGKCDWETQTHAAQAGIMLLLEHPAEAVLQKLKASRYPTRALVAWLIYEGQKIELVDPAKLRDLMNCWKAEQNQDA